MKRPMPKDNHIEARILIRRGLSWAHFQIALGRELRAVELELIELWEKDSGKVTEAS